MRDSKLDNGLKVLVLEDHTAPVVTVQIWYRVGSRNERMGIRGIAHLFEHMMFKGSERIGPQKHAHIIDSVGGSENAFTGDDVTAFHDTVPADRIELAMELEAERMVRLRLDEGHFFREREVVKEELRVRFQNNPTGTLFDKFRSMAYRVHPYRWTAIGAMDDLDLITIADIRSWYRTFYTPNNAVLIVVGDTTHDDVMQLAGRHFGPIPEGVTPPRVSDVEPEQTEMRREEVRFPTQVPVVIGGYKVPEAAHADITVLEVAQMVLGGGQSSRLHRKLVREKQVAVFAGAFGQKMRDPGLFMVGAAFMPATPPKDVEAALLGEMERLAKEGPRPEELAKAKNQLTAAYIFKLTSIWQVGLAIGEAELTEGDFRRFLQGAEPYEKITADQVRRVAAKYFHPDRLTLAVLLPPEPGEEIEKAEGKEHEKASGELDTWPTAERFLKLQPAATDPVPLPTIARKTLPNGLRLLVVERREQPVVFFDLTIPGGDLVSPRGQAGLSQLLASMIDHGTTTRTADELAMEVESLGGSIHAHASTEAFSVNGRFLARDLDRGLLLYADIVRNPTFPAEEIEKVRPQVEGMVRMSKDQPASLAFEHLSYMIYGYGHPRGRPMSLATLAAVQPEDLLPVYRAVFGPGNALLTVAGDVDAGEVLAALERVFGDWQPDSSEVAPTDDPAQLEGRSVRLVDKADLTQSTIALGRLGITKTDPDYFRLVLGNWVLGGGGFSSRLMTVIRARGGKSYGAGSWFSTGKGRGPFGAYTFTRNAETGATIELLLEEIEKIRARGVTPEELRAAKNNLAGSYALKLETPAGMADQLSTAEYYGLGEDWVRNYRQHVTAPSLEEVNATLARHLDVENMALVVVGRADDVLGQVETFGEPARIHYLDPVPDEERS